MDENKVISLAKNTNVKPGEPVDTSPSKHDNNGGGGNMNDKYVTHKEFNKAMGNIDKHFNNMNLQFEKINTKLEKQKKRHCFRYPNYHRCWSRFFEFTYCYYRFIKMK